MTGDQRAVAV